jgi:hypothetical protein
LEIKDDDFIAAPQSTEGLRLKDIPSFIQEHHSEDNWSEIDNQAKSIIPEEEEEEEEKEAAIDTAPVKGLLYAILSFFGDTLNEDEDPSDMGPKQLLTFMHRTDFRSMFLSLDPNQRNLFKTWVKGGNPNGRFTEGSKVMAALKKKWDDQIYAKPYYGAEENPDREDKMWPGDTFKEFFTSLWESPSDTSRKDSQSPPAGYASHRQVDRDNEERKERGGNPEAKYAMGSYPMVDGRALFEMRAYGIALEDQARFQDKLEDIDDGEIPYTQWKQFAQIVFQGAATRDESLKTEEDTESGSGKLGSIRKLEEEEDDNAGSDQKDEGTKRQKTLDTL